MIEKMIRSWLYALGLWLGQFKDTTLRDVITAATRGKLGVVLIALLFSFLDTDFWPNPRALFAIGTLLFLLFQKEIIHILFLAVSTALKSLRR